MYPSVGGKSTHEGCGARLSIAPPVLSVSGTARGPARTEGLILARSEVFVPI